MRSSSGLSSYSVASGADTEFLYDLALCGTCERRGSQDNSGSCAIAFIGKCDPCAFFCDLWVFWGPSMTEFLLCVVEGWVESRGVLLLDDSPRGDFLLQKRNIFRTPSSWILSPGVSINRQRLLTSTFRLNDRVQNNYDKDKDKDKDKMVKLSGRHLDAWRSRSGSRMAAKTATPVLVVATRATEHCDRPVHRRPPQL